MGHQPGRDQRVDRFPSGESHAVYRVSWSKASSGPAEVVVRVLHSRHPDDTAMAEREAKVLEKVGGKGAPRLYDFQKQSRWFDSPVMCLEYVDGRSTALADETPVALNRLGSVVARIHNLAAQDLVPWVSLPTDLGAYADERAGSILAKMAAAHAVPNPLRVRLARAAEVVARLKQQVGDLAAFRDPGPAALLHGDLGPGNLLWAAEPVLIDWEYARGGDPADELAYLFDQNGLDPQQRHAVWTGYQAVDSDRSLDALPERVGWWEPVQLLGSALWWVERFVSRATAEASGALDPTVPRNQAHYLSQVVARLDRFDGLVP